MPDANALTQLPVVTASPVTPITDLLASILSSYGTKSKAVPRKANSKTLPRNAKPLTFAEEYNELKTGYRTWEAKAKVIQLEEQVCSCCGHKVTTVKDELFLLSHKVSHSAWLRHEGYGIEAQEDLPVEFHHLEPRSVSACAKCASSPLDHALSQLLRSEVQLSFPF